MHNEFGGYLPLEMQGNMPYHSYGEMMTECNSGLTALYCALAAMKPNKVHLPLFICSTVPELVSEMGIECAYYRITSDFEPLIEGVSDEDCVLMVNYFGLCGEVIAKHQCRYNKVIIDNTQAFFEKPVLRENVYNIYSCRKFIGSADGGYCISLSRCDVPLEPDFSSKRYLALLEQIEHGTNYAYRENLQNYEEFRHQRRGMSEITRRVLGSADYSAVIEKRRYNFAMLDNFLKPINQLNMKLNGVPYSYPLMVNSGGELRRYLVSKKIYVPTMWRELITEKYAGTTEYEYSERIIHLPIDQRYGADDMAYIAQTVIKGAER